MKLRVSIMLFVVLAFILIIAFSGRVQAQTYIQYKVQLNSDCSAYWTITQVSGINGSVDSWTGFQNKVNALITAASAQTGREMSVDPSSFQISTNITSSDSKTTEYMFTWLNFSSIEKSQLVVGDVFGVEGFFNQLYGDGQLQINYPSNYTLQSVAPPPDEKDPAAQTIQWLGTQFFVGAQPSMTFNALTNSSSASTSQQSFPMLRIRRNLSRRSRSWSCWLVLFNKKPQKPRCEADCYFAP